MEYEVGTVLEGKVTSITKFGAFVALEGGKSGLVHISEIANSYVNDVHDFLQEGQDVKVKLLAIKDGIFTGFCGHLWKMQSKSWKRLGTFTNCSQQTHNFAKMFGYLNTCKGSSQPDAFSPS